MKYKSCKDIEGSIYIAPNEIRSCCQRFFYKDKMRGDAKLIDIENDETPNANDISVARQQLFEKIQNGKAESCEGCPFLYERDTKPNFNSKINHLSIEHHSVCNLRCSYCSEIYYGGKKSKYNVIEFIKYLSEERAFEDCKQVVWGGGEPTLDKSFEIIVDEINKFASPKLYHRVFTNSIRYHPSIVKFLNMGLIKIVTSIDAGTRETFKVVRGRDKFNILFENLEKYASTNPSKVTIKYIFTDENLGETELIKFVEKCLAHNLENCCYQISMNYKKEVIDIKYLKSILFLMGQFKKNGIKKFFCDDHIALRFKALSNENRLEINRYLEDKKIKEVQLNRGNFYNMSIFGAGDIAFNIISKTLSSEQIKFIKIYDSDPKKIGSNIQGIEILDSNEINDNDNKIYISAAQSYDDIFTFLKDKKIEENRILSGIFL